MQLSTILLTHEDHIPAAVKKARREFKRLLEVAVREERDVSEKVIDEIVELSVDDTPVREWPAETTARFLSVVATLIKSALITQDHGQIDSVWRLTDLLVSIVIADTDRLPKDVLQDELCRVWLMTRLARGIDAADFQTFISSALSALAPCGIGQTQLLPLIQSELLNHFSTRQNGPTASKTPAREVQPSAKSEVTESDFNGHAVDRLQPVPEPLPISQMKTLHTEDDGATQPALVLEQEQYDFTAEPVQGTPPTTGSPRTEASRTSDPPKQHIGRWQQPFLSETDVIDKFTTTVDEALVHLELLPASARQPAGMLETAKREFARWTTEGRQYGNTGFLSTSVHAARNLSKALLRANRPVEAFRVCNVFAEIAKMLVPRNREKFQLLYEELVFLACQCSSETRLSNHDVLTPSGQASDTEKLAGDLERLTQYSLGTRFRTSDRSFGRGNIDTVLQERIISDTVAQHFDKRLRHLLENDQPKVKQYVRTNMPVVYRQKLSSEWIKAKQQWERLLTEAGYDDVVRTLRDMGDLIDPEQLGKLSADLRDEISRAAGANEYLRVLELLAGSMKELRSYLYAEAQRLLQYREPPLARIKDESARELFKRGQNLAKAVEGSKLERSLVELQKARQIDITNLELLDWVAYVEARTGNLQGAEQKFEQLQRKRAPKRNFVTDWNLAVLKYERKNEQAAYQLLVPLLDDGQVDDDLIMVVLALSLKLDDKARFLSTVPRTMSLRFHPLAIGIAHEMKNTVRVEELLGQLLAQARGKWELPPPATRFTGGFDELKQTVVNKAIVENQTEQLIPWLEARIKLVKSWIPNYLALAWVLENEKGDVDGAFRTLSSRLDVARHRRPYAGEQQENLRYQRSVDEACEDLLNLCRRAKRPDLGRKAYEAAKNAQPREGLLQSFRDFAGGEPSEARTVPAAPLPPSPPPQPTVRELRDPKLADRVMWVNAGLVKIRNVHSYVEKSKEIEEFIKIVGEVGPSESGEALALIRNITAVIETFSRTDPENTDDRATRRTLYSRVAGYEKDLAQLLHGDAFSRPLADLITPYRQALQQVVGDLSRLAGVGPVLDVALENPFLSLESNRSALILRVTDKSERAVTDITVEAVSENPGIKIVGAKRRQIPKLESQLSELLSLPTEHNAGITGNRSEVTFAVSLRASAEGFPDVDLGIKKLTVPIKTFRQAMDSDQIPKLFQEGPLDPSAPELFHGRTGLLNDFRNSFYGGVQRERYFFDGIRRVGKTSLLKFLPTYVPPTCLPVLADFDLLGIRGRFNSAQVLRRFCSLIADEAKFKEKCDLDLPSDSAFETDPGSAFGNFLAAFAAGLPGRVPLLMMDEFQDLLIEIARSGNAKNRDTLVLDQLRGNLDARRLTAVFTGSVRFDNLTQIGADHRVFGSLKRLPVSFLNEQSVRDVLRAGMGAWGIIPPETAFAVHELTGGYPWLVQKYGLELINLLNEEHRTVAAPKDIEDITNDKILWDNSHFKFWWPVEQLGADEERFIEWLFRKYPEPQPIMSKTFFADVGHREQQRFRLAFDNLRACEVLDSTQAEYIRFSGSVMRRWLQRHLQDGQLHLSKGDRSASEIRGQAGIFIDHENFISSLEKISASRGVPVPERNTPNRLRWFESALKNVVSDAERRIGALSHKVAVAFWSRPHEAEVSPAYHRLDFQLKEPEYTGKGNEVDFKMADEARRARERASRENTILSRAIVVTGDSDLSQIVRGLKNDGVSLQVIGGSRNTGDKYVIVVGPENFIVLEDVCGL